jgi:hypothetical protein
MAANGGHIEVVSLLLDRGANAEQPNYHVSGGLSIILTFLSLQFIFVMSACTYVEQFHSSGEG